MEQEYCIFTVITSAQVVPDVRANSDIPVCRVAETAWNLVLVHQSVYLHCFGGGGLCCPACMDGTVYPVKVSLNSSPCSVVECEARCAASTCQYAQFLCAPVCLREAR